MYYVEMVYIYSVTNSNLLLISIRISLSWCNYSEDNISFHQQPEGFGNGAPVEPFSS